MIGKVRMLLAMGVNSNDLLASLDVGSTPLGIKSTVDAAAMCLDVKILPIGSSSIQSKVKLILNCRPSVIVGLPDEIVTIGKIISNCNITNPITKIISVGKSILPYYQDLKKYYPNSLIQNDIGSSELSQLIFTCPEGNQHVNIDLTHIVLNSENEIIATGLTSANPIFNYKTGDRLDGLEYGNCGCGSFLPMTNGFVERRKC
jgi:phenylacetate-coenzyme A ligase PaaK-like adenylate-forming protein